MKLIEVLLAMFMISILFIFSSTIFFISNEKVDIFWQFLTKHTENISKISYYQLNYTNCNQKQFTWYFLPVSLTWYFCENKIWLLEN